MTYPYPIRYFYQYHIDKNNSNSTFSRALRNEIDIERIDNIIYERSYGFEKWPLVVKIIKIDKQEIMISLEFFYFLLDIVTKDEINKGFYPFMYFFKFYHINKNKSLPRKSIPACTYSKHNISVSKVRSLLNLYADSLTYKWMFSFETLTWVLKVFLKCFHTDSIWFVLTPFDDT